MKNLFRIKKNFKKSDFNTLDEYYKYPSEAWKTHVRQKKGKIIIESGLLKCDSNTSIFRLYLIDKISDKLHVTEIINYTCNMDSKRINTADTMQRTLKSDKAYLVFRSSDFGKEYYFVTTMNKNYKIQHVIYGSARSGYYTIFNDQYCEIDRRFIS